MYTLLVMCFLLAVHVSSFLIANVFNAWYGSGWFWLITSTTKFFVPPATPWTAIVMAKWRKPALALGDWGPNS